MTRITSDPAEAVIAELQGTTISSTSARSGHPHVLTHGHDFHLCRSLRRNRADAASGIESRGSTGRPGRLCGHVASRCDRPAGRTGESYSDVILWVAAEIPGKTMKAVRGEGIVCKCMRPAGDFLRDVGDNASISSDDLAIFLPGVPDDFGRWVCPECKEEVALFSGKRWRVKTKRGWID